MIILRIATELLVSPRCKMRMFGIMFGGPTDAFFYNHSVMKNLTLAQSVLNKSHNEICYHRVREAQTTEVVIVGWIQGEYSHSDL